MAEQERKSEPKWERLLSMLARPRLLLGALTIPVVIGVAFFGMLTRESEGVPAGLILLVPVVFLAARGAFHRYWTRGWMYLILGWVLTIVAYGAITV